METQAQRIGVMRADRFHEAAGIPPCRVGQGDMDQRNASGSQGSAEGTQASPGEQAAVRRIIKEDHTPHTVRSALLRAVSQPSGDGKHVFSDRIGHP
jgi:hypothetical protein